MNIKSIIVLCCLAFIGCERIQYESSNESPSSHSNTTAIGITTGGELSFSPVSVRVAELNKMREIIKSLECGDD